MRGSVVCFVFTSALAGCWHGHHDDSDACAVVLVRPGNVNEDVPIRPTLRIEWSTAVDVADARVSLRSIDGRDIPVTLSPEGDRVAAVVTDHSLRFDTVYTLEVSPVAARDRDEGTCIGSTTAFHTVTPYEVEQPLRAGSLESLIQVDRYLIGSSRTFRGLQVFDLESPDAPALVGSMATDIHAAGIVADRTRAYIPGELDGVLIVDVSEPRTPREIGRIGTPGMARGVAPFTNGGVSYVAIADGSEGVRIVDVTDPVAPRTVSVFDPSGTRSADVRAVDVEGTLLAIADGARGYVVVDVSSPSSPRRIGGGYASRTAIDVEINAGLVYVSHFPAFIDVYDSRDASLPRIGGTQACDVCMQRYPVYLHAAGNRLHVTAAREGVRTYELDQTGGMTLTGIRLTEGPAFAVVETTDRVYVGEEGGLVGFDRATFGPPRFFSADGHGNVASVAVVGDHAYVAAASRGLQVFDLGNPEGPRLLASQPTPASPSGDVSAAFVTASPSTVFVGDVRGGLVTFDRAGVPSSPILMGQLQTSDGIARMVQVSAGVVLACQGNTGMVLADVSDVTDPRVIAERFFRDFTPAVPDYCIDVIFDPSTSTAYVAGVAGITVLEIGSPDDADPLRVIRRVPLPTSDVVLALARHDGFLYASTRVEDFEGRHGLSHRLQVFDLEDPHTPVWRSASADLGEIGALTLVDDVAFAAARELGVYVFDLSEPSAPEAAYLIPTRGDALSFAATSDALYVAGGGGGLSVVHTGPLPVGADRD